MTKSTHGKVYELVGKKLRSLRLSHGMTQAEVATLIDVSPQQYQKYEDAQTRCSLTTIVALSTYYGVGVETIVRASGVTPILVDNWLTDQGEEPDALRTYDADEDMLTRLVDAFLKLPDYMEKKRVVELLEAMRAAHA